MNNALIANDDGLKSLALAVARNRVGPNNPIEDVLAEEGVDPADFTNLVDDPVFKRYVNLFVKELEENGVSFKMKNRVLVEDAVAYMYGIVQDVDAPAAARIKAFETLARYAGYDDEMAAAARAANQQAIDTGPAFHITFNIPQLPDSMQPSIDIKTALPTNTKASALLEAEFATADET